MSPPPPRPDDDAPPPTSGWEVVEPARDPLLDDPLFAEIVEDKPLPDLKVEPPVAEAVDDLPVAEVAPARAAPVERPRPVAPLPPRPQPQDVPSDGPKPRVFAACAVLGCFGLGFVGAVAFIGWAALTLLSGISDDRSHGSNAAARPGPVGPTQMTEQSRQITLPGRVHAVGRAAGGRYLLLQVQQTRQIIVFDPNTGNLLNHRFDCGPQGLFTGSASKLFVYRPDAFGEELQRWDLASGTREKVAPKPADVLAPSALVTGAGVEGPVYLVMTPTNAGGSIRSIDPDTLGSLESIAAPSWQAAAYMHVRASDDGMLWGATTKAGAQLVRLPQPSTQGRATFHALPTRLTIPPLLATPARDGKLAYTPYGVADASSTPPEKLGSRWLYAFPTAHGSDLFLSWDRDQKTQSLNGPFKLHVAADSDVGEVIPGVDPPRGLQSGDTGTPPPDQRFHLWPAAGVAVTIPPTGPAGAPDQQVLEVRRVDVKALLEARDEPYLVIGSEPQRWAVRGKEWRYRPAVWTKAKPAPDLKLKLIEPPGDMAVQGADLVWTPRGAATQADVRVEVTAGDLVTEQRFRLTVVDDHSDD